MSIINNYISIFFLNFCIFSNPTRRATNISPFDLLQMKAELDKIDIRLNVIEEEEGPESDKDKEKEGRKPE